METVLTKEEHLNEKSFFTEKLKENDEYNNNGLNTLKDIIRHLNELRAE